MGRVKNLGGNKLLVSNTGPEFVTEKENQAFIENVAVGFVKVWDAAKESGALDARPYTAAVEAIKEHVCRPAEVWLNEAWEAVEKVFNDYDKVTWLIKLEDAGLDVAFCDETEVQTYLLEYFNTHNINKPSTIKNVCSSIRSVLRQIGRMRHVSANDDTIKLVGKPIMSANNPVTESLEALLITKVKDKQKTKKAEMEAAGQEVVDKDRLCFPASPVCPYVMVLHFLSEAVEDFQRIMDPHDNLTDQRRTENTINHALQFAFALHEGTRPGDIQRQLKHDEMFFPLHEDVPVLTMVIAKPSTYAYILRRDALRTYGIGCYKGKHQASVFTRMKTLIPLSYNSIDLTHVYILCMKLRSLLSPEFLAPDDTNSFRVFKQGDFWGKLTKALRKVSIKDVALYTPRYGMTADDKKCGIPPHWTRSVMGHSITSNMKDHYAANKDKRAAICDEEMRLGSDLYKASEMFSSTMQSGMIGIEFCPITVSGVVHNTEWLDETFEDTEEGHACRLDFEETLELTKKLMSGEEGAHAAVLTKLKADHDGVDWMSDIPFGIHIGLPDALCPKPLRDIYQKALDRLQPLLAPTDAPKYIPQLMAYPQTVYGNWRPLLQDVTTTAAMFVMDPVGPSGQHNDDPVGEGSDASPDEDVDASTVFELAALEVTNTVVVVCKTEDRFSLSINGLSRKVWIAQLSKISVTGKGHKATIEGHFFRNESRRVEPSMLDNKTKAVETVHGIFAEDIIDIYDEDDPDVSSVELTAENVRVIEARMKVRFDAA